jgi:hypothetical protein
MFQFTRLASSGLCIHPRMTAHDGRRVSPFGHHRIKACVRLPDAFRSLPRPSSPVRAKASPVRPCTLDRKIRLAWSRLDKSASSTLTLLLRRCGVHAYASLRTRRAPRSDRFLFGCIRTVQFRILLTLLLSNTHTHPSARPLLAERPPSGALLDPLLHLPSTQIVKDDNRAEMRRESGLRSARPASGFPRPKTLTRHAPERR